jgi:hypothetical protein
MQLQHGHHLCLLGLQLVPQEQQVVVLSTHPLQACARTPAAAHVPMPATLLLQLHL